MCISYSNNKEDCMKTTKEAYLISIYLRTVGEYPKTVEWEQDFEPTLPEILRKTVMHCVDKKLTNELLDNNANAIVRKIDLHQMPDEVATYNLDAEQLKTEFFEYIELSF